MAETQSPVELLASTGAKAKSLRSIAKDLPPKFSAILAFVVQGTRKPPCPSDFAPWMPWWTFAASAAGARMSVVPVSSIALRPANPESTPSTVTLSMVASQKPFSLTLSRVTRVLGSNLVSSRPLQGEDLAFTSVYPLQVRTRK